MANYERKLQIGADIRRKSKVKIATKFVKRMRRVQKETEAGLKKVQEEMKQQADKRKKEIEKRVIK